MPHGLGRLIMAFSYSTGWTRFEWVERFDFDLNVASQYRHLYRSTPVWVAMCSLGNKQRRLNYNIKYNWENFSATYSQEDGHLKRLITDRTFVPFFGIMFELYVPLFGLTRRWNKTTNFTTMLHIGMDMHIQDMRAQTRLGGQPSLAIFTLLPGAWRLRQMDCFHVHG